MGETNVHPSSNCIGCVQLAAERERAEKAESDLAFEKGKLLLATTRLEESRRLRQNLIEDNASLRRELEEARGKVKKCSHDRDIDWPSTSEGEGR